MKNRWTWFVASRYIFKGRGNSPILSVLGIATGVLALIVIIAVMNGFQLGFIETILEISSYHLRIENIEKENIKSETQIEKAREVLLPISGIKAVVPFKEFQALGRGRRLGQQAVLIRGLPEDALIQDTSMASRLEFEEGSFDISSNTSVLLGRELARRLGLSLGDNLVLYSITGLFQGEEGGGLSHLEVAGVFRTGFYEYDSTWAFININNNLFTVDGSDLKLGVKIANRFNDKNILEQAKEKMSEAGNFEEARFSSWRDYNRSFFGALRTEKLFMFIIVGLIFLVVGLNIFQSQRRSVLQRREEIGLLRAVGGSERAVRFVFVCDGGFIGLIGSVIGLVLGLLIASNISSFFTLVEGIVNLFIEFLNVIARLFGTEQTGDFSVFSPAVFYIKEIPSRILPLEVVIIFMFGFLSAFAAAWFASGKAAKIQPAEVLRYE